MKHAIVTTIFSATLLAASGFALLMPSYDLGLLINLGPEAARLRIIMAVGLVAYVLIPVLRLRITQILCGGGGLVLLGASVCTLYSPTLFGYLPSYVALGDVLLGLEAGILAIVSSLELPIKKIRAFKSKLYTHQLSRLNSQKLLPTQAAANPRPWSSKTITA